ncbi:DNA mismatch endonuclease Vsr [Siculibacillus lacustris]|uniref:DNA mismatch endonuclease Vsr n=1 Tax=Siculibacillus lacustris TaxID=1549641 RepID=A0A4Q9VSZ7_9HYPH|nr:DNA mismatch endonuclease Vsr [Siculibacillus lacustris]TBW39186.1 DNA mismatch endonuclease Vsr [Siculibacillus lacustris]
MAPPIPRPVAPSPERSRLLGRVRQRGTAPEEAVAAALRAAGLAYRRNVRALPGSPDFANRQRGFAIFVNGCFWHAHRGCRRATVPKNNRDFWVAKFAANRRRDAAAIRALRRLGFRVLVIWECEVATCGPRLGRLASRLPKAGARRSQRKPQPRLGISSQ